MSTKAGITEWRVHIGAHKTGTTHLQLCLADAADHLQQHGVTYIPLPEVRELLCPWVYSEPYSLWTYRAASVSRQARTLILRKRTAELASALQARSRTSGPMILSEENILGKAWRWDEPDRLYPSYPFVHMLHHLDGLSDLAPLRVFLAIRSMDEFLVSYYAERLKFERIGRNDLHRKIDMFFKTELVWSDLITRLRKAMPRAQLEVWNYDDYSAHSHTLQESLCGVALPPRKDAEQSRPQGRPALSTIEAAEAVTLPSGPERARVVRKIYADASGDRHGDRFDPVLPQQRQKLRDAFSRDLDQIAARFPGVLRVFD